MTSFSKLRERLFRIPIPNDMTESQILSIAQNYGCKIMTGGNHQKRIAYEPPTDSPVERKIIPIPSHGKHVPEYVIKELKQLIIEIECYQGDVRK